jgi:hypothetical protein
MPTKGHVWEQLLGGVGAPLYIGGGEAGSPKGITPQEVPPPLPSSCGWSSHSSLIILVDFPLKNQEFSIKTILIIFI